MQKLNTLPVLILSLSLLTACGNRKGSKERESSAGKDPTELSYDDYMQLKKTKSVVYIISEMKNQGVGYVEIPSDLSKYSLIADKNKMTMMFGMLSANIAYHKILGNITDIPEQMDLHLQFARKLNADPYLVAFFYTNVDRLKGNEVNDQLLGELHEELDKYQVELVDRMKGVDNDFLVYYTLGVLTEMSYYKTYLTGPAADPVHDSLKESYLAFVSGLYESDRYGGYARLFKPVTDVFLNAEASKNTPPDEKNRIILEAVNSVKNKVFY